MKKIVLTFDVEDWFQVRNMQRTIPYADWDRCEQRVELGLDFVLGELKKRNQRATFFILGWLSERFPEMVRKIAADGHEVASHGYSHRALDELSPGELDAELKRASKSLSAICGQPIRGFRAPSFSINEKTRWALEVLRENQFAYDSSIYPVRHPNYGMPGFGEEVRSLDGLVEVPMTTAKVLSVSVPVSGGGYFRLYPYALTRQLLRRVLRSRHAVMYFHPWEFDAEQPRNVSLPWGKRFRHYTGLKSNRDKFRRLLDDFEFTAMDEFLREKGFDIKRAV